MARDFRVGKKLLVMGVCIGPEISIFKFPLEVY